MTRRLVPTIALGLALGLLLGFGALRPPAAQEMADPAEPTPAVLVFSKTAGFRHASIPGGVAAIRALGEKLGVAVEHTEDSAALTVENLDRFDVVVFLSTTGDVLNDEQQDAFESYIRQGGGYVGVHAAADTEYEWPFYGRLVGAYFAGHPMVQPATIRVEARSHPSTEHLASEWVRTDEWYNFRKSPRNEVTVLLSLDESTYQGGSMRGDHPIAWCHEKLGGRAFYTGLGHTRASFREPEFLAHLAGGIAWAAKLEPEPNGDE